MNRDRTVTCYAVAATNEEVREMFHEAIAGSEELRDGFNRLTDPAFDSILCRVIAAHVMILRGETELYPFIPPTTPADGG